MGGIKPSPRNPSPEPGRGERPEPGPEAGSERCGAAGAPGRRTRELGLGGGREAGPFPRPHRPRGCGLPSSTDLTGTCSERI